MATRVAEILSTMTTPTLEMVFPATATSQHATVLDSTPTPQSTAETPVVVITDAGITPAGTPTATLTATAQVTTDSTTPAPTATVTATPTVTASSPIPPTAWAPPPAPTTMDSYDNWSWPTGSDDFLEVAFGNGCDGDDRV